MENHTTEMKPLSSASRSHFEKKGQGRDEINFDFPWLLQVVKRRLYPGIGIFVGIFLMGLFFAFRNPPEYQANVTIKIEDKKKVFNLEEYMRFENVNADFYASQIKLLQSRRLIRDVIEKMRLDQNPEILRVSKETLQRILSSAKEAAVQDAAPGIASATLPAPIATFLIDRYLKQLNVASERKTPQIITLSFTANQPKIAAKIANTHAERYIQLSAFSNTQFTDEYITGLQDQLNKINEQINQNEEKLLSFSKSGFFEVHGSGYVNPIPEIDDRIARIRMISTEVLDNLSKAKTAYESMFKPGFVGNMKYVNEDALTSSTLTGLRLSKSEASQQWEQVKSKYLENHPEYIKLKSTLASLESAIKEEAVSIVEQARKAYEEAQSRVKELKLQEEQLTKEKLEKEVQWSSIQDLRRMQEQLQKQKTVIVDDLQKADGSLNSLKEAPSRTFGIVDYAEVPTNPSNRNLPRIILFALAIAFSVSVFGILLLEFLDRRIRNPQQLEQVTGITVLGCIPLFKEAEVPIKGSNLLSLPTAGETFITLRSRFLFSNMVIRSKTVLLTSTVKQEGKSTILVNLASAIAQVGKRVLMLDCDLRKPRLHRVYGVELKPGLSDVVQGKITLEQAIHSTDIPELFFVPAGQISTTPTEIISSPAMEDLIEQLKQNFDFIFLDSPPVLSAPEASILSSKMDISLLVVRSGEVKEEELLTAVESIKRAGGSIFSTILNGVPPSELGNLRYSYSYAQAPSEAIPELK